MLSIRQIEHNSHQCRQNRPINLVIYDDDFEVDDDYLEKDGFIVEK